MFGREKQWWLLVIQRRGNRKMILVMHNNEKPEPLKGKWERGRGMDSSYADDVLSAVKQCDADFKPNKQYSRGEIMFILEKNFADVIEKEVKNE